MAQNDAYNRSFDSILKEKLDKRASFDETPQPASSTNSESSSESLWEKLAELGLNKFNLKPASPYPKSTPIQKPAWKPVGLPADITQAFEFFHKYGELITDKSSARELKRAYRQLAKSLHPDRYAQASEFEQKQQSKLFRELQLHYTLLSKSFNKAA